MITVLRATSRAAVLSFFLAGWLLQYLVGRLFVWTDSSRYAWRRFYLRRGAQATLAVLGGRVEVEGRLPATSSVVVSNHLGYADILVFASVATVVFVSRADVEGWAGVGPLAASAGTIFLNRTRRRDIPRALRRMRDELEHGSSVVFFPEGTSSDGTAVLPFRSSLFEAAAAVGAPVVCAALAYRTPRGEEGPETAVAWWEEELGFLPHFWRLARLSGFDATLRFVDPPLVTTASMGRRELSTAAQREVERALSGLRRDGRR